MTASLGWLGTGRMGSAIVGRLLDAGRPVTVWNRTGAKTARPQQGITRAAHRIAS
jgi:3-hydroxyisobutyrate dehydrogenase-like beta-hydroxyacid dehydrogenase